MCRRAAAWGGGPVAVLKSWSIAWKNEYGASALRPARVQQIRGLRPASARTIRRQFLGRASGLALDVPANWSFYSPTKWAVEYFVKKNPKMETARRLPHEAR